MDEPGARPAGAVVTTRWTALAVLLLGVVLVAFGVDRGLAWREAAQDRDEGRAAVAAARAEVLALTSVSATTSEADVHKLLDGATDAFRDEFEKEAGAFREALTSAKVTSTGEVVSAGLVDLDGSEATVLVAASGTVSNEQARTPEPRNYRMKVDLQKVDDSWLVSGLEFVG